MNSTVRKEDDAGRRYGLIGYPISHSLSPAIFAAAFKAAGIDARYDLYAVPPEELTEEIARLVDSGILGFNVTVPHKTSVIPMMERLDQSATLTGAVNTVLVTKDGLVGHNTDMGGFADSFQHLGVPDVKGGLVLVLGAGGAARAVVTSLCMKGALRIVIANKFLEETTELLAAVSPAFPEVEFHGVGLDSEELEPLSSGAVLCVQATSLGLKKNDPLPVDPACLPRGCFVYDLVYLTEATPFVTAASSLGHRAVDGKEMLLRQAARNFTLWLGREAPVQAMREGMEKEMAKRERDKTQI